MDILLLYQDFSVDYAPEGHKHARPGWVNTECPWCSGHSGYHLGYHLDGDYYFCYRCGWHPIVATVAKLIHLPYDQTKELVRKYGLLIPRLKEKEEKINKEFSLPTNIGPLLENHKKYLAGRGYDPDRLEQIWNLMSTGPVSKLDYADYKNRIIIPFTWNEQIVTFDSRTTSLDAPHEKRYKACLKDRELLHRKDILYGRQDEWRETSICVEGPADVWRFGTYSFGTSGIQYTYTQVRQMVKVFKRIAVVFDNDPQAILQATRLVAELKFRGVDAFRVDIENDPGSMKQEDADYLVKQLTT